MESSHSPDKNVRNRFEHSEGVPPPMVRDMENNSQTIAFSRRSIRFFMLPGVSVRSFPVDASRIARFRFLNDGTGPEFTRNVIEVRSGTFAAASLIFSKPFGCELCHCVSRAGS
jgi:hypothetical protein